MYQCVFLFVPILALFIITGFATKYEVAKISFRFH